MTHTPIPAGMTAAETAACLTDAKLEGNLRASWSEVVTDSRQAQPGALFIALRGERFDAHDFLNEVQLAGATILLVEGLPQGLQLLPQVAAIVVPNTRIALGQLAADWRRKSRAPLIGVTGSNGKTTVKEMIAAILRAHYGAQAVLATEGNLNNEIGVPLSALRLRPQHRAAVLEMGMNHPGEIGWLARIAQPQIVLVNNAQREHQEFMDGVEACARENGQAISLLPANGVAVFPHGDQFTPLWRELAGERGCATFGLQDGADIRGSVSAEGEGQRLTVQIRGVEQAFSLHLPMPGEHNAKNALAALTCAFAAGASVEAIVQGLQNFQAVKGRLQRSRTASGLRLIDDSYNANPDSVRAAIDVLAAEPGVRVLALGDMGEVGAQGPQYHAEVGAYAAERKLDALFCLGQACSATWQAWQANGGAAGAHCESIDALYAALDAYLAGQQNAVLLVKGSRFMRMERVVQHISGQPGAQGEH
ncbi:UDP-N-acetylmuramoyl-tripeptide--D-alanyl-D-alanine ligase [Massilia sp. W12]|uniref:UDP-N-acetylmuramoyl-tripeptide--D-alanyl-D- alanine ligase n=1 Tax=Massilia sp. W12 TaxID=3126507 RepID=UPI0030D6095E